MDIRKMKKQSWQECRTAHELGSLERPPISEWLRHLAGLPEREPAPAPDPD